MASFGSALAQSLAERMNERRRFLAEQRAVADERLRGIEASRRGTVDRARTALQASANALITSGFSEAEVSQIVETDPAEAIRLGTRVANDRLRADDIRTAITFRDDYRPGTPLSEIIREATPIFQDIEEPEPAARQQNIFQRMFSMDVSQDMDRYYRQSNFGGFSGYDVLGSVEADPFRARQGEPIVDYGAIPTQMTETSRTRLTNSAKDSITGRAATIIDVLRREGGDDNASIARRLDAIQDSPRAIIDFLFDDSEANAATYAALTPYREVLLEELIPVYQEGPSVFNTVSPRLSSILGEYVAARNEEPPEPLTFTGRPQTEEEIQTALDSLNEYPLDFVIVADPETGETRQVAVTENLRNWLSGTTAVTTEVTPPSQTETSVGGTGPEVGQPQSPDDYEVGSYITRNGRVLRVAETRGGRRAGGGRSVTGREFEEVGNFTEVQANSISEIDPEEYEIDEIVKIGSKLYIVRTETGNQFRNTPMTERPKRFVELGEVNG